MNIERKKVYSYFFKNEFRLHVDQVGPCTKTERAQGTAKKSNGIGVSILQQQLCTDCTI